MARICYRMGNLRPSCVTIFIRSGISGWFNSEIAPDSFLLLHCMWVHDYFATRLLDCVAKESHHSGRPWGYRFNLGQSMSIDGMTSRYCSTCCIPSTRLRSTSSAVSKVSRRSSPFSPVYSALFLTSNTSIYDVQACVTLCNTFLLLS